MTPSSGKGQAGGMHSTVQTLLPDTRPRSSTQAQPFQPGAEVRTGQPATESAVASTFVPPPVATPAQNAGACSLVLRPFSLSINESGLPVQQDCSNLSPPPPREVERTLYGHCGASSQSIGSRGTVTPSSAALATTPLWPQNAESGALDPSAPLRPVQLSDKAKESAPTVWHGNVASIGDHTATSTHFSNVQVESGHWNKEKKPDPVGSVTTAMPHWFAAVGHHKPSRSHWHLLKGTGNGTDAEEPSSGQPVCPG